MSHRILFLIIAVPVTFFHIATNASENSANVEIIRSKLEQLDMSRCEPTSFSVQHNRNKMHINFYYHGEMTVDDTAKPYSVRFKVGHLDYVSTSVNPLTVKNKTITDATWDQLIKKSLTLLKQAGISAVRWNFILPMSIAFTDRFGFKIKAINNDIVTVQLDLEDNNPSHHLDNYYKQCSTLKQCGCKTFNIQDNGTTLTVYHMPKISVDDNKEKKSYCVASLQYDYALLKNLRIHKNHTAERWEEYLIIKAMKKLQQRGHTIVGYQCPHVGLAKSLCAKFGFLPSTLEHPDILTFDFKIQNDPNDHLMNFYQMLNDNKNKTISS